MCKCREFTIPIEDVQVSLTIEHPKVLAALKLGAPRKQDDHGASAEIAEALSQVRSVLQLVEQGLVFQDALGQQPLVEPNTVRHELVLLNWAIARLNGVTDQPAPGPR